MQAISDGIGNGTVKEVMIKDAIQYPWSAFITINVKLECSAALASCLSWHCRQGITSASMKQLNDEFNFYRGLFPLKVFITGPPCSGKTHFAKKLNELYGVPHITVQDIVTMGKSLTTEFGDRVRSRVEELKD